MKTENEEGDKSGWTSLVYTDFLDNTVEFYDSKKDEKLEQWMKDHNRVFLFGIFIR